MALSPNPASQLDAETQQDSSIRLLYSPDLGQPPYVLNTDVFPEAFPSIPGKGGLRIIDDDTIVKYGSHIRLEEAETMHFVSKKTKIKCPAIRGAYTLDGITYIMMSLERGTLLAHWWDTASEQAQESVIHQLERYVKEMRSMTGDYIGGFNRSPCIAGEFLWDSGSKGHRYGPYEDEAAFNEGLIEAWDRAHPASSCADTETYSYNQNYATEQLVRSLHGHNIVFTHGDLNESNILIKEDLSVVILDWDTAGFYPDYWEWYKATWMGVFKPSFIRQVERYIPPSWMEANVMEQLYRKILG